MTSAVLQLQADCEARLVPSGVSVQLRKGTEVQVVQALGGNVTVNVNGNLAQIAARDADALGEGYGDSGDTVVDADAPLEEQVWAVLRSCYDPEIPVNVVDLGLVYDCRLSELVDGGTRVDIRMTLTAPGCGMGGVLAEDIERKLQALPGITAAAVEIVFDPPWSREMMSEAARLELGLL